MTQMVINPSNRDFIGKNGVMGYRNRMKFHRHKKHLQKAADLANAEAQRRREAAPQNVEVIKKEL